MFMYMVQIHFEKQFLRPYGNANFNINCIRQKNGYFSHSFVALEITVCGKLIFFDIEFPRKSTLILNHKKNITDYEVIDIKL